MDGQIGTLIGSTDPADRKVVQDVFGASFQSMGNWRSFLRVQLNANVSAMLRAPLGSWKVESFQALYIACWIHHPVEKGTFMLSLQDVSDAQKTVIRNAWETHCTGRKSSHLSGEGRSASKGWAFLNGYHELLVQYETTTGTPSLFLKAEGHTTGIDGIVPHMKSWLHKRKHGVGLEASPSLNALAAHNALVEGRAAENYAKGYGKLLKDVLNLRGKQVTVRQMMAALFNRAGYADPMLNTAMLAGARNRQLGDGLDRYCAAASHVGAGGLRYRANGVITQDMINDLRKLAASLRADGDVVVPRVFREIRLTAAQADQSLAAFYALPGA